MEKKNILWNYASLLKQARGGGLVLYSADGSEYKLKSVYKTEVDTKAFLDKAFLWVILWRLDWVSDRKNLIF